MIRIVFGVCLFFPFLVQAQKHIELEENLIFDSTETALNQRLTGKYAKVNQCTPWHHLKCVYTTGKETYDDGRIGKRSKHWWHMSYIGQACQDRYGRKKAVIYEGLFVIPHYFGVGLGTEVGKLVTAVRGPPKL